MPNFCQNGSANIKKVAENKEAKNFLPYLYHCQKNISIRKRLERTLNPLIQTLSGSTIQIRATHFNFFEYRMNNSKSLKNFIYFFNLFRLINHYDGCLAQ